MHVECTRSYERKKRVYILKYTRCLHVDKAHDAICPKHLILSIKLPIYHALPKPKCSNSPLQDASYVKFQTPQYEWMNDTGLAYLIDLQC